MGLGWLQTCQSGTSRKQLGKYVGTLRDFRDDLKDANTLTAGDQEWLEQLIDEAADIRDTFVGREVEPEIVTLLNAVEKIVGEIRDISPEIAAIVCEIYDKPAEPDLETQDLGVSSAEDQVETAPELVM